MMKPRKPTLWTVCKTGKISFLLITLSLCFALPTVATVDDSFFFALLKNITSVFRDLKNSVVSLKKSNDDSIIFRWQFSFQNISVIWIFAIENIEKIIHSPNETDSCLCTLKFWNTLSHQKFNRTCNRFAEGFSSKPYIHRMALPLDVFFGEFMRSKVIFAGKLVQLNDELPFNLLTIAIVKNLTWIPSVAYQLFHMTWIQDYVNFFFANWILDKRLEITSCFFAIDLQLCSEQLTCRNISWMSIKSNIRYFYSASCNCCNDSVQ